MLVLSRLRDQSIVIDARDLVKLAKEKPEALAIRITVVDIRGDKVRLGITAPSSVPVHRDEVFIAIEQERQAG